MERFHCDGWLILTIDTAKKQTVAEITHRHHVKYVDVRITEELKEYILENIHHTPRYLWENIGMMTGNITEKQLHRWWVEFSQHAWKLDENQVQSAIKLINQHNIVELMFSTIDDQITAIAFGIKELIASVGVNAVEIGMDATCKYSSLT